MFRTSLLLYLTCCLILFLIPHTFLEHFHLLLGFLHFVIIVIFRMHKMHLVLLLGAGLAALVAAGKLSPTSPILLCLARPLSTRLFYRRRRRRRIRRRRRRRRLWLQHHVQVVRPQGDLCALYGDFVMRAPISSSEIDNGLQKPKCACMCVQCPDPCAGNGKSPTVTLPCSANR